MTNISPGAVESLSDDFMINLLLSLQDGGKNLKSLSIWRSYTGSTAVVEGHLLSHTGQRPVLLLHPVQLYGNERMNQP